MISKREIILRLVALEDDFDKLNRKVDTLSRRVKKLEPQKPLKKVSK